VIEAGSGEKKNNVHRKWPSADRAWFNLRFGSDDNFNRLLGSCQVLTKLSTETTSDFTYVQSCTHGTRTIRVGGLNKFEAWNMLQHQMKL
jgi:hypothetical protein